MEYTEMIAQGADSLPPEKQAEVLDFIEFLKAKQSRAEQTSAPKTAEEIAAFFRSFNVDTSRFKFDRDEANAR
jgi:Protein of unknown function (DUF2281)